MSILYNLTSLKGNLVQETGRVGRDYNPAKCILFYTRHDICTNYTIVVQKRIASINFINFVKNYCITKTIIYIIEQQKILMIILRQIKGKHTWPKHVKKFLKLFIFVKNNIYVENICLQNILHGMATL